ncbi:translation initiation factor 3 (bIF-3) [Alkalibaculum bacchi]|uniref:Translation initiation factor IF-3 n=1 Tax=Alkalibaculum bacchi TaxID=645887 RepID=A0A366IAM4_9FIRM|nr:translation initiation factor IF-3 [Alkalibaculum bacchi]RBP65399.1 translation initiation factor 3 (bIF-3) [Alkalibaculum bacchi]
MFINWGNDFSHLIIWRCVNISKEFQINEQIRDKEVRVIDQDDNQLGVMSGREAQRLADERELDLVKISPNAKPPVCRILDYGKFRYEQSRKEKEAKKKQKVINIKEIRMSANVQEHDLDVKAKNCRKFLENGDRVKASVRFRGREMSYTNVGKDLLLKFAEKVSDVGKMEKPPRLEGRSMVINLVPLKENN